MSDLKRLLERSLREKEPDDFENITEKVEEFIRDNKVDENAGKQLRAADPRIQKEVIHRGGLLECKNPSAVCLARIREERKLLGESLDVKPAMMARKAHESIRDGIVNRVDMNGAVAQVQAQQFQAQQRLIMAQQMALLQGGMGGMGGMNAIGGIGGIGAMGGVASLGSMGTLPGMPGIGGVAPMGVAGMGGMLGMGAMGSMDTLGGAVAGMAGMPASMSALNSIPGMSIGMTTGAMGSTMPPQVMMHNTQPAAATIQANPATQPALANAAFNNPSPSAGVLGVGAVDTKAGIAMGSIGATTVSSMGMASLPMTGASLQALGQSVPSTGLPSPAISSTAAVSPVMTSSGVASTAVVSPSMTSPGMATTSSLAQTAGYPTTSSSAAGVAPAGLGGISMVSASSGATGSQLAGGQASSYGLTVGKALQRASPY